MLQPTAPRRGRAALRLAVAAGLAAACLVPAMPAVGADAGTTGTEGRPGHGHTPAPGYEAGPVMNYVVNAERANRGQVKQVERAVADASGTVLASYPETGVVVAQSDNANFAAAVRIHRAVESAGATRTAEVLPTDPTYAGERSANAQRRLQATEGLAAGSQLEAVDEVVPDPLEAQQWDMAAIGVPEAHAVTEGSERVLVAVLDSGIDGDHPDLQAAVDTGASASCLSGVPDGAAESWQPTTSSHGTHVAGTIAAQRNGVGIVGVAPGVRLSAVKVVSDDGFIYPESAICGFMHAAATGADITNNSYYIDPWMFWCGDDADQAAVLTAVERTTAFTERRGVLNVAAAGNSSIDLANKTVDDSSPNDTTPVERPIDAGCLDIPTEIEGVVTVSSTQADGAKSGFSNYGLDVIDVAAPGSAILSTIDGGGYGTSSGTSMASPHAAGVLALLASTHPWAGPEQLAELLERQAVDTACPAGDAACSGGPDDNAYFGEGLVSASAAVQRR
jgi:subtilisin family serine protease